MLNSVDTLGEVGFLSEQRRSNVAITRARRHLAIIGDSSTVSHEPFLNELLEHISSVGEVQSAFNYIHGMFIILSSMELHKGIKMIVQLYPNNLLIKLIIYNDLFMKETY